MQVTPLPWGHTASGQVITAPGAPSPSFVNEDNSLGPGGPRVWTESPIRTRGGPGRSAAEPKALFLQVPTPGHSTRSSPGSSLEMQPHGLRLGPTESEPAFKNKVCRGDFYAHSSWGNTEAPENWIYRFVARLNTSSLTLGYRKVSHTTDFLRQPSFLGGSQRAATSVVNQFLEAQSTTCTRLTLQLCDKTRFLLFFFKCLGLEIPAGRCGLPSRPTFTTLPSPTLAPGDPSPLLPSTTATVVPPAGPQTYQAPLKGEPSPCYSLCLEGCSLQ
ncbi:hypothetical protein VULLAG_LOCUS309 [Vulpes lagopus]